MERRARLLRLLARRLFTIQIDIFLPLKRKLPRRNVDCIDLLNIRHESRWLLSKVSDMVLLFLRIVFERSDVKLYIFKI